MMWAVFSDHGLSLVMRAVFSDHGLSLVIMGCL